MTIDSPIFVVSASGITAPTYDEILEYFKDKAKSRKLFKNPCSQAELNKIVPFGFSLQRQKKWCFFCHQNSIILLC